MKKNNYSTPKIFNMGVILKTAIRYIINVLGKY